MRILHIMGGADAGGVAMVVYNYMRHINQNLYHFDFALTGNKPGMLGKKMINLGAHFYQLPLKSRGIVAFEKALTDLLKREHFDAVHVHENSTSYVALRVAKKCGISCRIAHAHTAGRPQSLRSWIMVWSGQILNRYYATRLVGCGDQAGKLVFGDIAMKSKKALVLPNAIETDLFRFNTESRKQIRQELNIGNRYTIGMIGRLASPKNQLFMLSVVKKLHEQMSDFIFILVGQGEYEKRLKEYCYDNNMEDYVLFTGIRNDINRIYQGLDICVLPSLYEGFPVVGLEAIAAGLPLILSEHITQELSFTRLVKYLPLEKDIWVDEISRKPMNLHRESGANEIKKNHFDINETVNLLENLYKEAICSNETNYYI